MRWPHSLTRSQALSLSISLFSPYSYKQTDRISATFPQKSLRDIGTGSPFPPRPLLLPPVFSPVFPHIVAASTPTLPIPSLGPITDPSPSNSTPSSARSRTPSPRVQSSSWTRSIPQSSTDQPFLSLPTRKNTSHSPRTARLREKLKYEKGHGGELILLLPFILIPACSCYCYCYENSHTLLLPPLVLIPLANALSLVATSESNSVQSAARCLQLRCSRLQTSDL